MPARFVPGAHFRATRIPEPLEVPLAFRSPSQERTERKRNISSRYIRIFIPVRITSTNSFEWVPVDLQRARSALITLPAACGGFPGSGRMAPNQKEMPMKWFRSCLAWLLAVGIAMPTGLFASSHREAPITALDHKADITDVYAFVSYSANQTPNTTPSKVTMILNVDPLLEPANGPNWFPFDPEILYEIHVDNDQDALADVSFQIRFQTQFQLPGVYSALAGIGDNGANAPGTSTLVVPPQIRDFNNPGLNLRQTYTVTMVRHRKGLQRDGDDQRDDKEDVLDSVQLANSDGS